MIRIIGIMGAAGAGKSTVALHLQESFGARRVRFADGLKRMLRAAGLTEEQVDGGEKLQPVALLCGRTPRHAMQTLGTGWGRNMIGPGFWTNITMMTVTKLLVDEPDVLIVIDDVRHHDEIAAIRSLGGEIWVVRNARTEPRFDWLSRLRRVRRPLHESETLWRKAQVDRVLTNDRGINELRALAAQTLAQARHGA